MRNAVRLVTGCSPGLGRAIAEQLLDTGYRLVATARDPSNLGNIFDKGGDKVTALAFNVAENDSIAVAICQAEQRFGAVDVLFNNVGYGYFAALEKRSSRRLN